ncbi:photoreceptor outer segment membrane glycoprotein 2-like [Tubulanus polymorphus]|uniref:photoreceptor outer segment membrane glycoprotein 2-like n=1 Tax=Tubulanus polymorphus TaxID=672921 RepID=UPI003DA68D3A
MASPENGTLSPSIEYLGIYLVKAALYGRLAMSAILAIPFTELRRHRLAKSLAALAGIAVLSGAVMVLLGVYMKVKLEKRMQLLDNYNGDVVPSMLMSSGIILVLIFSCGIKIWNDCAYPGTRKKFVIVLLAYQIILFLISWVILTTGCMCFTHTYFINDAFTRGLKGALGSYKKDMDIKTTIDDMQMKYKCCGSNGHSDWYAISWINGVDINIENAIVKSKMKHDEVFLDHVPFSCCDPSSMRPCVDRFVRNKSLHGKKYTSVTLYKTGCADALRNHLEKIILKPSGILVLIIWAFNLIMIILAQYLRTSIKNAVDKGNLPAHEYSTRLR